MASDEQMRHSRALFVGIIVALIFTAFMSTFVWYMSRSQSDVSKLAMRTAANTFSTSAINTHWKWRIEGSPQRVILIEYNRAGKETDRRPITMSHLGWPRVEPNTEGCQQQWLQMLGLPMELQGFKCKRSIMMDYLIREEFSTHIVDIVLSLDPILITKYLQEGCLNLMVNDCN